VTNANLALPFLDADLEARVRAGLDEVESRLSARAESDAPFVTEAARHLLSAGGKRFRPMLVLCLQSSATRRPPGWCPPRSGWS